jgi:hypothetical protein
LENSQMKKTLIAMAAVAVAGVASAQVSLTGTFNLDVDNKPAETQATVGAGDVILSATASEDLGGGMSVKVNTTLQTANGRGGKVTNNGYSMDVAGGFGTITYKNYLSGAAGLSAGVSAENDMNDVAGGYTARSRFQYTLPTIAEGLSASLYWDASNTAPAGDALGSAGAINSATDGTGFKVTKYAVSYASGPLSVAMSNTNAAGAKAAYTVTFDAGVAQLAAYTQSGATTEFTITAPLGALNVGFHNMSGSAKANGYTASYALSKRTSLRYSYVNETGTGGNYRVRLGHSF